MRTGLRGCRRQSRPDLCERNAKPYVQPVADAVGAELLLPLDVEAEDEMEAVFAALKDKWGRIWSTRLRSVRQMTYTGASPIVRAPDLRAPWTSRSIR
jgi:hypothetical protein